MLYILLAIVYVFLRWQIKAKYNKQKKMMILFGSGGHTTEMLLMFSDYDFKNRTSELHFVHSDADIHEPSRVKNFLKDKNLDINWITIPRSRKVKQSYFSSIFTTIYALIITFFKLLKIRDLDILVVNGPGTCIPVIVCLYLQYFLFLRKRCKVLYIESWCRTEKLSVSGRIAKSLADRFIVHWKSLPGEHIRLI